MVPRTCLRATTRRGVPRASSARLRSHNPCLTEVRRSIVRPMSRPAGDRPHGRSVGSQSPRAWLDPTSSAGAPSRRNCHHAQGSASFAPSRGLCCCLARRRPAPSGCRLRTDGVSPDSRPCADDAFARVCAVVSCAAASWRLPSELDQSRPTSAPAVLRPCPGAAAAGSPRDPRPGTGRVEPSSTARASRESARAPANPLTGATGGHRWRARRSRQPRLEHGAPPTRPARRHLLASGKTSPGRLPLHLPAADQPTGPPPSHRGPGCQRSRGRPSCLAEGGTMGRTGKVREDKVTR